MEINKLIKSTSWFFILVLLSISCKNSQEKTTDFSDSSSSNTIIENANDQIIIPNKLDKNTSLTADFDISLSYFIEPDGDPRTAITYIIEDFDEYTAIFKKESYSNAFEYTCTKQKKGDTLQLFYKTTNKGEAYNSSEPLITIYKKNDTYYAASPIVENNQEIKLSKE